MVTISIKVYKVNKSSKVGTDIPLVKCRNIKGKLKLFESDLTTSIPSDAPYVYKDIFEFQDFRESLRKKGCHPTKCKYVKTVEKGDATLYEFTNGGNLTISLNEKEIVNLKTESQYLVGSLVHSIVNVGLNDNIMRLFILSIMPLVITSDDYRDFLIKEMGHGYRKIKKAMTKYPQGDYAIVIDF